LGYIKTDPVRYGEKYEMIGSMSIVLGYIKKGPVGYGEEYKTKSNM
jgi:hypothetical protein